MEELNPLKLDKSNKCFKIHKKKAFSNHFLRAQNNLSIEKKNLSTF